MEPIHVLVLDTVMDRGGAEAMIMNYMRNIDRDIIKFDFLTNRDYRAAYEDEIEQLGGKIYHMCPMYPKYFRQYKKEVYNFLKEHPEYKIVHSNLEERSYFPLKEAKKSRGSCKNFPFPQPPIGSGFETDYEVLFQVYA